MADVTVDATVYPSLYLQAVRVGPIWISVATAYIFYTDDSIDLVYQKTTDGGATWASPVSVHTGTVVRLSVWYDRWTPGNVGTTIHVVYAETDGDDILYRSLNTVDDNLGTETTVFDGTTFEGGGWSNGVVDVVVSRGGNLYCGFWGDTDGEYGFYRSTNEGATWTSRAQLADGNPVDGILLMPGDETDNADVWCIYWDRSADELSLKIYDDSDNSWSETSIATSMADNASYYQMSAAPRHSDNHVILAAWSELAAATADLKVWDIGGSDDITALTNVVTDLNEAAQVAVFLDQISGSIYVVYLKGGTWFSSVDVKYKKSTDGGVTWGSEQNYSEASADDLRAVYTGISVGADGGRFQPVFFNDDLGDLFVNLTNDVNIPAVVKPLRASYVGASWDAPID